MGIRPNPRGKQARELKPIWNSFDFTERKALAQCSKTLDFKDVSFKQWDKLTDRQKQELITCAIFVGLVSIR